MFEKPPYPQNHLIHPILFTAHSICSSAVLIPISTSLMLISIRNTDNLTKHQQHVREVLTRLCKHGPYAKAEKCEFHVETTEFLGYILTPNGLQMGQEKVQKTGPSLGRFATYNPPLVSPISIVDSFTATWISWFPSHDSPEKPPPGISPPSAKRHLKHSRRPLRPPRSFHIGFPMHP